MNRIKKLIPIMLVILLSLLLIDCSCTKPEAESTLAESTEKAAESSVGPAESKTSVQADISGQYEITAMVSEGKETTPEDLALMKDKGLNCTITLKTDGTGVLDLFGDKTDLTWDGSTISSAKKTYRYTFEGDQLTLTEGNSSLSFVRTE